MKKRLATTYAICCTLSMTAGFLLVFFFAWREGVPQTVAALVGCVTGFILAPIAHELGHFVFGRAAGMELVYAKAFCFKITVKEGKKRLSFASPFLAEQTQMLPEYAGNMASRAKRYVLGGLLLSGLLFLLDGLLAILSGSFVAWGVLPYSGYLLFLNVLPLEYPSGKTDAMVYRGILRGESAEKCMLAAMELQGELCEGSSFGEIERDKYFDLPQVCEEEPIFAVLADLRYRYYLDLGDMEKAADCLNRLACSQAYLSGDEVQKLAAELTYMHSLRGNVLLAEESGKLCREYLSSKLTSAKRILAAFALASGNIEGAELLKKQAQDLLVRERIAGVRKLEEKLLARIKIPTEEKTN